jgi:hypothetical protein
VGHAPVLVGLRVQWGPHAGGTACRRKACVHACMWVDMLGGCAGWTRGMLQTPPGCALGPRCLEPPNPARRPGRGRPGLAGCMGGWGVGGGVEPGVRVRV